MVGAGGVDERVSILDVDLPLETYEQLLELSEAFTVAAGSSVSAGDIICSLVASASADSELAESVLIVIQESRHARAHR